MALKKSDNNSLKVLSVFLGILALSLILIIVFSPISRREKLSFYLDRTDLLITDKSYKAAEISLIAASNYSHEKRHWYRILKRALIISEAENNFKLFTRLARKSIRDIPGNEDLWAFYISGLLWSGDYKKAFSHIDHIKSSDYRNLKAEVMLRYENEKYLVPSKKDDPEMLALKYQLEKSHDPLFFEYIGEIGNNPQLLFNASLLYMKSGQVEKMGQIIKTLNINSIPLKGLGLLSYDSGNPALASDILVTLLEKEDSEGLYDWEVLQIIADSQFLLFNKNGNARNAEKAITYYLQANELNDERKWMSLLNVSLIKIKQGYLKSSYQIAQMLLDNNSGEKDVVLFFAEYFYNEYPVIVERIIFDYQQQNPDDSDVNFMELKFLGKKYSTERYKSLLWNMYNSNPGSEIITRYLLWYLLGSNQYEETAVLIDRISNTGNNPSWVLPYKAVYLIKRGLYDDAQELYDKELSNSADWKITYNRALLYFWKKDWNKCESLLMESDKMLLQVIKDNRITIERSNRARSDIYSILGFLYLNREDLKKAFYYLDLAVEYDGDAALANNLNNTLSNYAATGVK